VGVLAHSKHITLVCPLRSSNCLLIAVTLVLSQTLHYKCIQKLQCFRVHEMGQMCVSAICTAKSIVKFVKHGNTGLRNRMFLSLESEFMAFY
jgi:hypothetical protein